MESIWDVFSHTLGKTFKNETGDVADDFYHLYEKDLDLLESLKFNSFRLSFAWPRILPRDSEGRWKLNPKGVAFYKKVLSGLHQRGIQPFVTMFHWDLPKGLDWLDEDVVPAFLEYAETLFKT